MVRAPPPRPAKDTPRAAPLCAKNDCTGRFVIRSEWDERNPASNRLRNRENQQINMMGTVEEEAAPAQGVEDIICIRIDDQTGNQNIC